MELRSFVTDRFTLQSGVTPERLSLAYATHGTLNEAGDNCVLLPTYYTGTHDSYAPLIGPDRALDPARYFIVIPNILGNGVSSAPSRMADYSDASIADNVRLQHALLTALGVRRIQLVQGWSMGAMQGFAWAAMYPAMVARLLAVCGTARCWPLNQVFLEGVKSALTAAASPAAGKRAFGRAYAGWAYSAAFYRDALYRDQGHATLEAFLAWWEEDHLGWDANDLLAMLWTWQHADLGFEQLSRITAKTVVMPCDTDMYFNIDEARQEAAAIPQAEFHPLHSPYGHCAGAPGRFAAESAKIEETARLLLGS